MNKQCEINLNTSTFYNINFKIIQTNQAFVICIPYLLRIMTELHKIIIQTVILFLFVQYFVIDGCPDNNAL